MSNPTQRRKGAKGRVDAGGRFYCPCGAEHSRGPINGLYVWRCLACGNAAHPNVDPVFERILHDRFNQPTFEDIHTALAESLKLQAHYGELLNMHDGGKRLLFPTIDLWLARLRETGTLQKRNSGGTPTARS